MNTEQYPSLLDRVKALFVDALVLVTLLIIFTQIFTLFGTVPDFIKIITFVFIFFLYDPLFTSLLGGTLGHMLIGLRVKKENNPSQNILFPLALVRFFVKSFLGWASLLTVSGNAQKKAIHDMIVGSVVIYRE